MYIKQGRSTQQRWILEAARRILKALAAAGRERAIATMAARRRWGRAARRPGAAVVKPPATGPIGAQAPRKFRQVQAPSRGWCAESRCRPACPSTEPALPSLPGSRITAQDDGSVLAQRAAVVTSPHGRTRTRRGTLQHLLSLTLTPA